MEEFNYEKFDDIDEGSLNCNILDLNNDDLPVNACSYCGISDPECVAKCHVSTCQKWFCNGQLATSGSHIVNHLVRSKHKEVSLHQSSKLGETILECYSCGGRNVFLLGFVPATHEGAIVLLCRETCLSTASSMKDIQFDVKLWEPIIKDRSFVPWIVKVPSINTEIRDISAQQINKLEELWKVLPAASVDDLNKPGINMELQHVLLKYNDAKHYHSIFSPIVAIEAEYDKRIKESQKQENVIVRWDIALNQKRVAYFIFAKENNESRLVIGDELRLKYIDDEDGTSEIWIGHVAKLTQTEEVCLELRVNSNIPGPWDRDLTTGFVVEFVWKSTSFDRMQRAMERICNDNKCMSDYIFQKLLGHDITEKVIQTPVILNSVSAPGQALLNHSQVYAVHKALQSSLCVIQGPPGTGKTVTSATIVYHLSRMNKNNEKVLVVAPSNVAVDQLAERIHKAGLNVVRVAARSREAISSSVENLSLHVLIKDAVKCAKTLGSHTKEFVNLMKLKEEVGELSMADERQLKWLRSLAEFDILSRADVICSTCVGAGDARLAPFKFKQVLIDEATQATEPECLIPLVMGAQQVVLVGDHCQLGPVIMCKRAAKAGLSQSFFERLVFLENKPIRLEVQYRMHPCLSEFPSHTFYDGSLQNGITLNQRIYKGLSFPWPNPNQPMFFYNSYGYEEISASGTSYLNRTEAVNIENIVTAFLKGGLSPNQIGVITPYDGQRAHISAMFLKKGAINNQLFSNVEVASVDAFQGREKDFIVLSCVRSNDNIGIGFLHDPRRLNVALTRAKYGLVICGNAKVLAKQHHKHQTQIWCNLLNHYKKFDLIQEGQLFNLNKMVLLLPKPVKMSSRYHNAVPFGFTKLTEKNMNSIADIYASQIDPNVITPTILTQLSQTSITSRKYYASQNFMSQESLTAFDE